MPNAATAPAAAPTDPAAAARLVPLRIHALRAGTWPAAPADLTISDAQIAATAAAYDPQRYHAPVVIGHPDQEDPAWGWVESASADARGLWLDVLLLPDMAELVRLHRYRAVSVALWPPQASGNPAPGVWSLKHLGFLGAVPPAVKGLDPVRLAAAADDAHVFTLSCIGGNQMADQVDAQNAAALAEREQNLCERDRALADRERRLAEREHDLCERDRALTVRERHLAEREQQLRQQGFERDLDAHVGAGRVLAADRAGLVALMERLAAAPAVTLAEAGEQPALELLRGFLGRLPARVDLSERAGAERAAAAATEPAAAPAGYTLSERGRELHCRAREYMAAHEGTDYLAALRAVDR